jgi:sulfite reductase alpha subunit-like flavoprotein
MSSQTEITRAVIVHGGQVAQDVAIQLESKKPDSCSGISTSIQCASLRPKNLLELESNVLVCIILQTIENASPTEQGSTCLRLFKRKTHPENLLDGKFQYTVLGLGDSNLLLDRQTTTAKDCNQCAKELDARLEKLSGKRAYELGMGDERTGYTEVEPWIDGLWAFLSEQSKSS